MSPRFVSTGEFLNASRFDPQSLSAPAEFTLDNGTRVNVQAPGIIRFSPASASDQSKWVIYSCGVHGNETAPIEICDDLVRDILLQKVSISHNLLVLFGNLPAMDIGKRFVEENMNRLFSGAHSAGPGLINDERHRAKELEDAVAEFFTEAGKGAAKFHYDLHS